MIGPHDDAAGRPTIASMRTLLIIAGGLVFLAGAPLVLVPDQTNRYFAWTIQPPMTAVFSVSAGTPTPTWLCATPPMAVACPISGLWLGQYVRPTGELSRAEAMA